MPVLVFHAEKLMLALNLEQWEWLQTPWLTATVNQDNTLPNINVTDYFPVYVRYSETVLLLQRTIWTIYQASSLLHFRPCHLQCAHLLNTIIMYIILFFSQVTQYQFMQEIVPHIYIWESTTIVSVMNVYVVMSCVNEMKNFSGPDAERTSLPASST